WCLLSFEAQGLYALLKRKCDRAGMIPLGGSGELRGVAVLIGHAHRWGDLERPLGELIDGGWLQYVSGPCGHLMVVDHVEAEEAITSDRERARRSRERRRALSSCETDQRDPPSPGRAPPNVSVTFRDAPVARRDDCSRSERKRHPVP